MPNLALEKKKNVSSFRKLAIGTWSTSYDPSVYGTLTVRMDQAVKYRDEFRAATGKHLTVSHMMAKAVAAALQKMPDANAILRWNRIYLRKRIGVFFQVAIEDEETGEIDLSGATVFEPERMTLAEIIDDFDRKVRTVRSHKDKELEGTRSTFKRIPFFLLNRVLKLISFFSYTLNLNLRWLGIPRDPFGSVMITNIGSLGLQQAFVPLVPYSRVPLLLAMGAIEDTAVVEDDRLVIGKVMQLCATFDHRVLDGAHAAIMAKTLRTWLEDPYHHFDPLPETAARKQLAQAPPRPADRPEERP